jgi:hypothetical protein
MASEFRRISSTKLDIRLQSILARDEKSRVYVSIQLAKFVLPTVYAEMLEKEGTIFDYEIHEEKISCYVPAAYIYPLAQRTEIINISAK